MKEIVGKRADMGIGTLILFIAFILVSAVAASVIILSSVGIQSKALNTGKGTSEEVSTSMVALEIYALNASDNSVDNTVDYFYETVKVTSGSEPIEFSDILLTLSTNNVSQDYSYNPSINCDTNDETSASSIYNTTNSARFGVKYSLSDSVDHVAGSLYPDEIAKVCFKSPRPILEAENILIDMVPKKGSALRIDAIMPSLMMDERIYVYP